MTKSERWWRCVATVYGANESGDEMVQTIVMDSESKVLLNQIIDDSNEKLRGQMLEFGMVKFSHVDCRCVILNEDPKLTKAKQKVNKVELNLKTEPLHGKPNYGLPETEFVVVSNTAVDLRQIAVAAKLIDKFDYETKFKICAKGFKLKDGHAVLYAPAYCNYLPVEEEMMLRLSTFKVQLIYNPNNWAFRLIANNKYVTSVTFYLSLC